MPESQADFVAQVSELLKASGQFTAGSIKMLDLDALKEEAGDRWPAVRSRITDTARQVMQAYLTDRDVYLHLSDSSFIIVFSEYSGDAAKLRVAEISRELRRRLLSHSEIPGFDFEIFNETQSVSADAVTEGMAAFSDFVSRHQRLEVQKQSEDPFVACANARVSYAPLWDSRVEASFKAALDVAPGSLPPRLRRLRGAAEHASDRRAQAVIDCAVLAAAVSALRAQAAAGGRAAAVICPVICATSFSTDSLQNLILPYLRSMPEESAANMLPILRETRLGASAADLRAKPPLLRQFSRAVGLLTRLDDANLALAKAEGFATAGVDARDYPGMSAQRLAGSLEIFAAQARRCGMRSFLLGADSAAVLRAGMAARVDLIAGASVRPAQDHPPRPVRIPRAEISPEAGGAAAVA